MAKKKKRRRRKKKSYLNRYAVILFPIFIINIILLICAIFYAFNKNKEEAIINQDLSRFSSKVPNILYETKLNDLEILNLFLKDDNKLNGKVNIKVNGNEVNNEYTFNTLGENNIDITLTYDDLKFIKDDQKELHYVLVVKKSMSPYISNVHDIEAYKGDELNLQDEFTGFDTDGTPLDIEIKGDYDINIIGTYPLKVIGKRDKEILVEESFNLIIKEKITTTETTTNKTSNMTTSKKTTTKKPTKKTTTKKTTTKATCDVSASTLKNRGYKTSDKDACTKNAEATKIAKMIADEVKKQGFTKDIDKVSFAAEKVSFYYSQGVHVEKGLDYATPYGVFVKKESSCAGCTRALIQVLEILGYKCTHANENEWTHQWVILTMDGKTGFADGQVGLTGYGCHPVDDSCTQ